MRLKKAHFRCKNRECHEEKNSLMVYIEKGSTIAVKFLLLSLIDFLLCFGYKEVAVTEIIYWVHIYMGSLTRQNPFDQKEFL